MTVRRSRTVPVPLDAVWTVVGDPHHLPRWWPLTERVEAVDRDEVLRIAHTYFDPARLLAVSVGG